jgi:negative regulator of sigma E activity
MSTQPSNHHEQLSALADGELGADEARFLLRRCDADRELVARWQRYHVARACLRREPGQLAGRGFADRIAQRIDAESPPLRRARWWQAAAGAAIAASVGALALFSIAPQQQAPSTPQLASTAQVTTGDLEIQERVAPVSYRMWAPLPVSEPLDPRVEGYFLRHSTAANTSTRGGFLPYVYVVATPNATPAPRPAETSPR